MCRIGLRLENSPKTSSMLTGMTWYVWSKARLETEMFNAHTRPKASFDVLEPTERPFCTTRGYWESTENRYKSSDVRKKFKKIFVKLRSQKKEVLIHHGPSLLFSNSCTSCGSHSSVKEGLVGLQHKNPLIPWHLRRSFCNQHCWYQVELCKALVWWELNRLSNVSISASKNWDCNFSPKVFKSCGVYPVMLATTYPRDWLQLCYTSQGLFHSTSSLWCEPTFSLTFLRNDVNVSTSETAWTTSLASCWKLRVRPRK